MSDFRDFSFLGKEVDENEYSYSEHKLVINRYSFSVISLS